MAKLKYKSLAEPEQGIQTFRGNEIITELERFILTKEENAAACYHLFDLFERIEYLICLEEFDFVLEDLDDFISLIDVKSMKEIAWYIRLY